MRKKEIEKIVTRHRRISKACNIAITQSRNTVLDALHFTKQERKGNDVAFEDLIDYECDCYSREEIIGLLTANRDSLRKEQKA